MRFLADSVVRSFQRTFAPDWAKHDGRTALYEEKKLRDEGGKLSMEDLRNIGDQYTQLKNNLERQGNYLHAGEFHFAEQEIRRKILKGELKNEKDLLKKTSISYSIYLSWCYKWRKNTPVKSIFLVLAK